MISIIIPTYNEAEQISSLLSYLRQQSNDLVTEIILVDGGSTDATVEKAQAIETKILKADIKSRAAQMNYGAKEAIGEILLFIHADTIPPTRFALQVKDAIDEGFDCGRWKTKFDSDSVFLKMNAFFTRFDLFECYGGDQGFFIKKSLFEKVGGFDESKIIMEDYDMTQRSRQAGKYIIMQDYILVNTRKYKQNSWLKVQKANVAAVTQYKAGMDTKLIAEEYKKKLKL